MRIVPQTFADQPCVIVDRLQPGHTLAQNQLTYMFFKLSVRQALRATFCSPTSLVTPSARVTFAFGAVAKAITRGRTSVPVLCRCLDIEGLKLNLNPLGLFQLVSYERQRR